MELVTGIAAASGGHCVLLSEGQRLQTKVRCCSQFTHPGGNMCTQGAVIGECAVCMFVVYACVFMYAYVYVSICMCVVSDCGVLNQYKDSFHPTPLFFFYPPHAALLSGDGGSAGQLEACSG